MYAKKRYIWNASVCTCENDGYLWSIIDDSVIICDEIMEPTKNNFYILVTFLLINIILSIIVSIFYYCKKTSIKTKVYITILT